MHLKRHRGWTVFALAARSSLVVAFTIGLTGHALGATWFGGNGNWSDTTNWTPPLVPGPADTAILNAGIATLTSDVSIAELTLGGAALSGAFAFTASAPSSWTSGTLSGAASTSFTDLAISGAGLKVLVGGRILNLNGATTWSGNTANNNNAIRFWNGATLNNNGTFNDANPFGSFIEHNVGGPHNFNNVGTYNKQSNTITTVDNGVAFNNTGTVNINAGTFRPSGGGTSTGTFNIANGAKLNFQDGAHTLNNVTTSGAGIFEISTDNVGADASVALNGGTHTTAFVLSGSTLTGSDHTFAGAATWSGGAISGAASTTFNGGLTITGANTKTLFGGRTANLTGLTNWSGNTAHNNNAILFRNGGTLNNNGTFNDVNGFDSAIVHQGGGPHNFNNIGTYNKQSATVTSIGQFVAFNNTGTVNVNAGTLLPAGGTSTGTFNIAAGAVLEFRNGASTLSNATTSGAGIFRISSDGVGGDAVVTLNGGTHTTAFELSGSALTGGNHAFQGAATWTGGAIAGAASTTFNGGLTISGPNTKVLVGGRTLELNGVTNWSGNTANDNNAIRFWAGATLNNNGTFNDSNTFASFIEHNTGGPHIFNNVGTYNKTEATTTTFDLGIALNNTGTMNVDKGTIVVSSAMTNNGLINVASGATFRGNNANFVNAGTFAGNGTFATNVNGDILNQGVIAPGLAAAPIGELSIDGDLRQAASGSVVFDLALASVDRLAISDDIFLTGSIVARNAGYIPVVGDSFVVMTFDERPAATTFGAVIAQGFGAGIVFDAVYDAHSISLTVVAVPEPQTYAMLLAGLVFIGFRLSRRSARA